MFTYQWVRSADGADTDISDATSSTYVVSNADAGSTIKVRVSFTDDDGYTETLTSNATASIPANNQNQPRQETDATLSDLAIEDASDDSTIPTNPSFLPTTTAYTASVTRDVDEITIMPTLNDSNATYEIQDANSAALVDADTGQDDFQVELPLGATTIKVEVTAEDGNTTEAYTVVVTRARVELLSANLTVGRPSSGQLGFYQGLYGSLSDRTFSFAGTNYTIRELVIQPGDNILTLVATSSFNQKAKDLLVLQLDGTLLDFANAGGVGNRSWSGHGLSWSAGNRVRVIIAAPTLPSNPTGLAATADGIDRIDLVWQAPDDDGDTDITGYRIAVSDNDGTTWTNLVSNTGSTDTTYSHTAVSPGTTQHYRVSAINGLGKGPASNVATTTTGAGSQVWSATVTVGLISSIITGTITEETFGYSADDSVGSISNATFMIGSTEYTVELVSSYGFTSSGNLFARLITLDFDKALPTDAIIVWYVGGESYLLADATVDSTEHSYQIIADTSSEGLEWSAGETVSMSLAIANPDPTLSGLTVNDGANDLTLIPAFTPEIYDYAASVDNAITTVTLSATVNHTGAEVTGVTLNGNTIADTDFSDGIAVPSLIAADNEIVVTVTAEDDTTTQDYTVTVTREPMPIIEIPAGWGLIPTGLSTGDQFRLIFISSATRNANSSNIATYNTWVQNRAAAGHDDIQAYSAAFRAVGCTDSDDARDNTETTGTGVPIYWLDGNKVADNYADFYDGDWDDEANNKNQLGNNGPDTSQLANYPWTGCDHDGTESFVGTTSRALGTSTVRVGRPNSSASGNGPLKGSDTASSGSSRPLYGLSPVFQVSPPSDDATLSALTVNDGTNDLTLEPAFASTTYVYTTDVDTAVTTVTFTTTVNHSGAEVTGVTLAGTAITDTDFTDGITVPSLVDGDNEIVVTVTAEDDTTTQDYTVTVTREPPLPVLSSLPSTSR